ncbi:MAG: DegT/DnrJ/EryC1/StrS family aminotransferase [Gammaproteobacteria bacterium]|nr:DegT/DnrJ/EryC1/StrS family aminotransferase [Gammaproteobacteria bacterium]
MEFSSPLADAKDFVAAKILALPTQQPTELLLTNNDTRLLPDNIISLGLLDHARTGLYVIAKAIASATVWLPSYHCPALVEPLLAANKTLKYYPVTKLLTPDFDFLSQNIEVNDAVVGIRYFGFDCEIKRLAQFCHQHNLLLIEDLAHAAFFEQLYGDVAVTSLIKFYPVTQGAEILLRSDNLTIGQYKQILTCLPDYRVSKVKQWWRRLYNKFSDKKVSSFRYFNQDKMSKNIADVTKSKICQTDKAKIVSARRSNYQYLATHLANSSWGELLMPELGDHVTPYVVPFLLHSEAGFSHIRQQAIQIYRWEELMPSACRISRSYRSRLVQLPCHQDLSPADLDCIVACLKGNFDEAS